MAGWKYTYNMSPRLHAPSAPLAAFIKSYLIIEHTDDRVNRVLPDTSLVMAFRYKGHVSYVSDGGQNGLAATVISGLRRSGRLIHYAKNTGNILVLFKEAAAHAFLSEPLYELYDESVALDNFRGYRHVSELEEQLAAAPGDVERIRMVERFLLSKLHPPKPDALIAAALEKIRARQGAIRMKELAAELCISQDAFEKRFRRLTGVAPKQFAYIVRMRGVLQNGLSRRSLTATALNAGYFDQSHFNKDFKLFTGQSPTEFLKSPDFW